MTQIDELRGCWTPKGESSSCSERGGKDTALRLVTVYNDWIGYDDTPKAALAPSELADEKFVEAQCWVVVMHGGQCADLFHVLNGPEGTKDAGPYLVRDHVLSRPVACRARTSLRSGRTRSSTWPSRRGREPRRPQRQEAGLAVRAAGVRARQDPAAPRPLQIPVLARAVLPVPGRLGACSGGCCCESRRRGGGLPRDRRRAPRPTAILRGDRPSTATGGEDVIRRCHEVAGRRHRAGRRGRAPDPAPVHAHGHPHPRGDPLPGGVFVPIAETGRIAFYLASVLLVVCLALAIPELVRRRERSSWQAASGIAVFLVVAVLARLGAIPEAYLDWAIVYAIVLLLPSAVRGLRRRARLPVILFAGAFVLAAISGVEQMAGRDGRGPTRPGPPSRPRPWRSRLR